MADDDVRGCHRVSRVGDQPEVSVNTPAVRQEDVLQIIVSAFQSIADNVSRASSIAAIKQMHEFRVDEFRGTEDDDSIRAEYWLEQVDKVFGFINPTTDEKLQCAVALLKDEASRWWKGVLYVTPPIDVNWEFFLKEFRNRYGVASNEVEKLSRNQGKRTYDDESSRIAVGPPEKRFRNFQQGDCAMVKCQLGHARVSKLSVCKSCGKYHYGKCRKLAGKCFQCGSQDHFVRNCPRNGDGQSVQIERSDPNVLRGGRPGQLSSAGRHPGPRVCRTCGKSYFRECRRCSCCCFRCGSQDHFVKDCPRPAGTRQGI